MVSQQVLRIVGFLGLLAGISSTADADPSAPAGKPAIAKPAAGPSLGLIDLRPQTDLSAAAHREQLSSQLATIQGFEMVADSGLRAALLGESHDHEKSRALELLGKASAAFGKPDCPTAVKHSEAALLDLAGIQAAGASVSAELARAHSFQLLCAHQRGDTTGAAREVVLLRALGYSSAPEGIDDAVWSQYPEIDAHGGIPSQEVSITVRPSGARVWVDHKLVGTAPVSVLISEGQHLVATAGASSHGSNATRFEVHGPQQIAIALPRRLSPWVEVQNRVRTLKSGAAKVSARSMAGLVRLARIDYALVIDRRGALTLWRSKGHGAVAVGAPASALETGAFIADSERGPGLDPNVPLLRDDGAQRTTRSKGPTKQQWWVYAAVAGAVLVGAGIVIANDLADDHQRVEITFP